MTHPPREINVWWGGWRPHGRLLGEEPPSILLILNDYIFSYKRWEFFFVLLKSEIIEIAGIRFRTVQFIHNHKNKPRYFPVSALKQISCPSSTFSHLCEWHSHKLHLSQVEEQKTTKEQGGRGHPFHSRGLGSRRIWPTDIIPIISALASITWIEIRMCIF